MLVDAQSQMHDLHSKNSVPAVAVTVLIGFADALSAPEVAWSLADSGFQVVAFAKKRTRPALCRSRIVKVECVTDPAESLDEALSDLHKLIGSLGTPVLMPLDDASLWLIQELSKRMPACVAGATGAQAEVALDKRLQLEAAAAAGFSVPETRHFQSANELKAVSFLPGVIKPALAARSVKGRLGRGHSYTVADAEELTKLVAQWNPVEPMLAQPHLKGVGEGLFGLALGNEIVCWSAHRRVRMMNPSGSGASACVSVHPDSALQIVAERFLRAIQWRGMFMIELLRDAAGRLWFIELNGRAWGSMALARKMGFEYPAWTVRRLLDTGFVPVAPTVRSPILCRHLGRELLHLAFVWRGPNSRAFSNWPRRTDALRQVLRPGRSECWYNYNKRDPKVFGLDTWQTLASQLRLGQGLGISKIAARGLGRLRRPILRHQQAAIRAHGVVANLLKNCKHILFLCYGNINRSALAEQHLRQLLGPRLQISSCGFHLPDQRPLDPMMRSLAKEFGVNFPAWSSRRIDRDLVDAADLILAMDVTHLVRLFAEYPETRGRAFLLSCVTQPKTIPLEIQDPFGRTPDEYRRCIREVTYATTVLSATLKDLKVPSICSTR